MIDQSQASRIFGPHHPRFWRIVTESWSTYQKILKEYPFFADDKTARANVVHAKARALSHEEFDPVAGVVVAALPPSSFKVVVDGYLHTRIKKFDAALRPDNVATDQNDEMMAQLPLPGHGPSACYPIVGYVLNELETSVQSVHVTLPMPDYNLWAYEIFEDGAVGEVIEMMTITPLDDLTKTKIQPKPQFRPKDKKTKKRDE